MRRKAGAAIASPPHADALERVRPVYRALPGWRQSLGAIRRLRDLPRQVRSYLEFIETFTGVGVSHVSLGGEREQTIEDRPLSALRAGAGGLHSAERHFSLAPASSRSAGTRA